MTSTPSLIPASSRNVELTHTAAQDSVVAKSKKAKTRVADLFAQETRATKSNATDKQAAKAQTASQGTTRSLGLAFSGNHFQNTNTAKNTNEKKSKTFIPGESLLKPTADLPTSASNRGTVLTRTAAQDSIMANQTQAQRKTSFDVRFGTQTIQSKKITGGGRKKSPEVLKQEIWAAVEAGDQQLGYASKLERELEKKYGNIDYAQYVPEYKNTLKSIQDAQAEYQKQREFIEKNYRQLPLPSGQTTNHTNADRWYYEDRLRQVREEMERYDELCGGQMDLASLRSYYETIHLYESILAAEPNTKGEQYMDDSFEQLLKGNYTDKVTGLGTAYQMGLGLTGLDLPLDIRDAAYDWTHLKTTPWHQTLLDTAAFLPFVGTFKYTDNVADLAKGAKAADALATTAKHSDDAVDLAKYLDDAAAAAKKSDALIDIGGKMDYNSIGVYSSEEVRHWYVQQVSSIHDSIDSSLPMAERARQAFEARNQLRTTARNMMSDQNCRQALDEIRPNATFDELINRKMKYKGLTYEEALRDIYETAVTTNETVNKAFHIGG